eukprot:TRINITY_DN9756_c0_g2_i2.p1 TRINITY_DN9756_c0_g2~~TRINITY_DN9756_c0_g2_i2.p1  ORF type:complete len:494 (-),score=36.31 TRINITY_DN9756_c0_g2_i2:295-1776(-)
MYTRRVVLFVRAAFATHCVRILLVAGVVLLLVYTQSTVRVSHEHDGTKATDFWLQWLYRKKLQSAKQFTHAFHPVLLIADLLILMTTVLLMFIEFANQQHRTRDVKCALAKTRDWTFRFLHKLSLFWYFPILSALEFLQRAARRARFGSHFVAYVDAAGLIAKTARLHYWHFMFAGYLGGRRDRCLLFGRCSLTLCDVVDMVVIALPISFYLYGVNDLNDLKSDLMNSRKLGSGHNDSELCFQDPSHTEKKTELMNQLLVMSLLVVFLWWSLQATLIQFLASGLFLFLAWSYSAPPLRTKEVPFLDVIWNCGYKLTYFIGLAFLQSTKQHEFVASKLFNAGTLLLMACAIGHMCMDRDADRRAGHNTLIVRYGPQGAAYHFLSLAGILVFLDTGYHLCYLSDDVSLKEIFRRNETVCAWAAMTTFAFLLNYVSRDWLFKVMFKDFMCMNFAFVFSRLALTHDVVNIFLYQAWPVMADEDVFTFFLGWLVRNLL